jgi:hypothetical protein
MAAGQQEKTIREWMQIFKTLYSEADSKKTPQAVWSAAIAHCSAIGESIRTTTLKKGLLTSAAHAFCWICSFLNRCNQGEDSVFSFKGCLSGVVALKYPNVCGHCIRKPCKCNTEEIDKKSDKAAHYEVLLGARQDFRYEDFTVGKWQNTFNSIFGNNIHQMTLDSIGFHFLEEVGEVVTAVRRLEDLKNLTNQNVEGVDADFLRRLTSIEDIVSCYAETKKQLPKLETHEQEAEFRRVVFTRSDALTLKWRLADAKMALVIEIADTFSWFCSVLNKIQAISADNEMGLPSLEQRLVEEYFEDGKARCPTCRQPKCTCLFYP